MNTDPSSWYRAGAADRNAGNELPGMTSEDFSREIEDEFVAVACNEAYRAGFEGRAFPSMTEAAYASSDPKSEGYHDRVSDLWDSREGK